MIASTPGTCLISYGWSHMAEICFPNRVRKLFLMVSSCTLQAAVREHSEPAPILLAVEGQIRFRTWSSVPAHHCCLPRGKCLRTSRTVEYICREPFWGPRGFAECHWFDFSGWFWAESSSGLRPLPRFWQQRSGVNNSQISLVIFVPTNGNYFRMQKTVNTHTQGPHHPLKGKQ